MDYYEDNSGDDFDPFDQSQVEEVVGRAVEEQLSPITTALGPIAEAVAAEQEAQADAQAEQWVNNAMERLDVPEHDREQVLLASGGYRLAGYSPEEAIAAAAERLRTTAVRYPSGPPRSMLDSAERIARKMGLK
jgi:hypothetical protein